MHAASVHPEPGSNSRKNSIISNPSGSAITFSSYFILASLTLLRIYNSLTRSAHTHFFMLCTSLLLFNFQWPLLPPFRRTAWLLYHTIFYLSIPFLNFFEKFFIFFKKAFMEIKHSLFSELFPLVSGKIWIKFRHNHRISHKLSQSSR